MPGGDSYLAGWRVRSEVPLPDLLPWTGLHEKAPDIEINVGPLPECPAETMFSGPLLRIGRDKACWFTAPGVASFFLNPDATGIIVSAGRDGPATPSVRLVLLSTVFALVCYRRGLFPLHASCVEIGGQAVAFAGPSCAGKSLLAAACMKAGCAILSDDITPVDSMAAEPSALPSFPRLRLWRDAVQSLGFAADRLQHSRPEIARFEVPAEGCFSPEPRRLAAIYHLRRRRKESAGPVTSLNGARAMREAAQSACCAPAFRALVPATQVLAPLCSGVSSFLLECEPGLESAPALVELLLSKHGRYA